MTKTRNFCVHTSAETALVVGEDDVFPDSLSDTPYFLAVVSGSAIPKASMELCQRAGGLAALSKWRGLTKHTLWCALVH